MLTKQKGFTLVELVMCIMFIGWLCLIGGVVYVAIHYLSKIW